MKYGSPELRSFVNFILRKNPSKRPDADIILLHPFIQKYQDLETSDELCHKVVDQKSIKWIMIIYYFISMINFWNKQMFQVMKVPKRRGKFSDAKISWLYTYIWLNINQPSD